MQFAPVPPLTPVPVSTDLLPISMDLPLLDISFKWNHTVGALLSGFFRVTWCLGSSVLSRRSALRSFFMSR